MNNDIKGIVEKDIEILLSGKVRKNSNLSEQIVYEILLKLCEYGVCIKQLSQEYNTKYQTINSVLKGLTYKKSFSKLTGKQLQDINLNIKDYNKFTRQKIKSIIEDLLDGSIPNNDILKKYNMSIGYLIDIATGNKKWLEEIYDGKRANYCWLEIYDELTKEQQKQLKDNFNNNGKRLRTILNIDEIAEVIELSKSGVIPIEIAKKFNINCKKIQIIVDKLKNKDKKKNRRNKYNKLNESEDRYDKLIDEVINSLDD